MGDKEETVTGRRHLKVDYKDKKLQLDDEKIFLGGKVDGFLKEMGLRRDSEEIKPWIQKVRLFYEELLSKMFKHFGPSLKSKTLRYLSVLCPSATLRLPLDELMLRWKNLDEGFPNIINPSEVDCLVDEVVRLKTLEGLDDETEAEEFYKELSTVKGVNGDSSSHWSQRKLK